MDVQRRVAPWGQIGKRADGWKRERERERFQLPQAKIDAMNESGEIEEIEEIEEMR